MSEMHHACVCMWFACTHTPITVCVVDGLDVLCLPPPLFPLCFETGSLPEPDAHWFARVASKFLRSACPRLGLTDGIVVPEVLHVITGNPTQFLMLVWQERCPLSYSPGLHHYYFFKSPGSISNPILLLSEKGQVIKKLWAHEIKDGIPTILNSARMLRNCPT